MLLPMSGYYNYAPSITYLMSGIFTLNEALIRLNHESDLAW